MKRDGYLSQPQLRETRAAGRVAHLSDEVTVAIGRDGSFLVWEGAHRTVCATILGVERIPVKVMFRHEEWDGLRKRLEDYAGRHGGKVLEPLLHPDLDNIPAGRECDLEFEHIRAGLAARGGSLVDLTPGWGYLSQRFEQSGFRCTAVIDRDEDEPFLRMMRDAQECHFDLAGPAGLPRHHGFDIALALDLVRDGEEGDARYGRLLRLLEVIDPLELFVKVPSGGGPRPGDIRQAEGLLRSIAERGGFAGWSAVGEPGFWTGIHRLWRQQSARPG
jgi:hypothetical protein